VKKILMYSARWCPFCVMAKRLLATKGVEVEEVAVDSDPARRIEMVQRTGRRTVPQIFVGERHIDGRGETPPHHLGCIIGIGLRENKYRSVDASLSQANTL
jgi:glutaredoxin 3